MIVATKGEMVSDKRKREIGYVCARGHYVFEGEEDWTACGSKKIAILYTEAIETDREFFYDAFEGSDEEGNVFYSSSGYSADDYEQELDEAHDRMLTTLRLYRG